MKKTLLLSATLLLLYIGCSKENPEDENLDNVKLADITTKMSDVVLKRLVIENFDYNKDGMVSSEEAELITELEVGGEGIYNMQGIEFIPNLRKLHCNYNNIGSLDVSKNTQLQILECNGCELSSLDLSNNVALSKLECYSNNLTSLDLSHNPSLKDVSCHGNHIASLDLTKTTSLRTILCSCPEMTSVKIAGLKNLEQFSCYESQLSSLDLNGCSALKRLYVYSNKLTSLDLSDCVKLTQICCQKNQISTLDLSMCDLMNCLPGYVAIKANDMPTLKTIYLKQGWSIEYITYNRNTKYIPATTEVLYK